MRAFRTWIVTLAIIAGANSTSEAGDLDPPGAPAPTPGAEPRVPITAIPISIEEAGSYYLTSNLTMSGNGDGIHVLVSDVTIDLNGFTLAGDPMATLGMAITRPPAPSISNLIVLNGTVRDWPEGGIDFSQGVFPSRADGVIVSDCGGNGIYLGNEAVVRNCIVEGCTGSLGIGVNVNSSIENCIARGNDGHGIRTGDASAVRGCTARDNGGHGISADGSIIDCSASDNSDAGIFAGSGSVISGCSSEGNRIGIEGTAVIVANCQVNSSGSLGINVNSRSSVIDCSVIVTNVIAPIEGIEVNNDCQVRGSLVRGHLNGDGISVVGDGNRIDGNSLVDNTTGIDIDGSNNLVVRNSFSGNDTNIGVPLNPNTIAPTVTSANIGTSGNPHANYSH